MWSELLGVETLDSDDFFLSGGDSLATMQMVAECGQLYGVDVAPREVFDHSTVDEFVHLLRQRAKSQAVDRRGEQL